MKKFILASAFALMATPALFAQSSNTYSMQIELKDGTKITLGPNDLKNITFVDGVIKIEGNTIEELRSSIEKAEANTKNMVEEQRYNVEALKQKAAELQVMIDYLSDKVAKLENAGGGSGNTEDITALQAAIAMLQSELAKLQSSEMAMKTDVAATNEKINNVQAMVKATEAAIMDLQKAVKDLSSGSSGSGSVGNEERIKLLEEAVDKLKADMKNLSNIEQVKQLQDQIYALQAMVNVVATNSTGNQALADELKVKMTAVEAALANLKNSSMNSQVQIDKLTVESNNVQDDLNATKKEFMENIQTLSAALAKTNNNLDSVSVTILQRTMAEIGKLEAAIVKESDGRQEQAANLENKIETNQDIMQSNITTLEGIINKEISERIAKTSDLEKAVAANKGLTDNQLKELQYKIDMIIEFLNANIFHSNYGENAFDKWAGISQ